MEWLWLNNDLESPRPRERVRAAAWGTEYVWTKEGWTNRPKVSTLDETLDSYGKVQGGGVTKNEGGYYNYIGN